MKIDARHVMALRRLTDLPVSMCREALVETGGDLVVAVQRLRESPCCVHHASDTDVAAVLAGCGVAFMPIVRQPVVLPDNEVVAELTADGCRVPDHFLIDESVYSVNTRGELMVMSIDDDDLAHSINAYLRRVGVPEYPSMQAYEEQRSGHKVAVRGTDQCP